MISSAVEQLRLADFDYDLPAERIAQEPSPERDRARLMIMDRGSGAVQHRIFSDIDACLRPGDLLVMNDTMVFPCRLAATKPGGGKAEIFLLAEQERNVWHALVKGGPGPGKRLCCAAGAEAEILRDHPDGSRTVRFHGVRDIRDVLGEIGSVPLPPYIKRPATDRDRERYQTVYASRAGAVAAPTAGLHFTKALLAGLAAKGVEQASVTLHVGPGTFQPVRTENISLHRMHPEKFSISASAAERINRARADGRRVIAVGTTSVRTIETASQKTGAVESGEGESALFIYPGYRFRATDGIITNFHLPKSTLLMLVSAFAGRERVLAAYRTAVVERYRFYSYGDAMFIC